MSAAREIERAQADVCYCHDRVALLRAKLYRWGMGRREDDDADGR
jgi:hypothetical protein